MSKSDSKDLLESFLDFIKKNSSNSVKILNFGTFYNQVSKRIDAILKLERIYNTKREKIVFKASSVVKNILN